MLDKMKLPIIKEECGRRMMTMSGSTTGGRSLICERRETSLVGGHAARGKATMDLGSGDTSTYFTDIQSNYDSYTWETRFDTNDYQPTQSTISKTHIPEVTSNPPQVSLPSPTVEKTFSTSRDNLHKYATNEKEEDENPDVDDFFERKENHHGESKKATTAVVEDSKQPKFTANESNPTVPALAEPSKTSTLRLSDRTRSESEDDIEKMEEPEQDGALIGHKTMYKTTATTENSPNSEKMDKNGNRSDLNQNETDNDCVVQCLYYTIQCCECVIF